MTVKVAHVTTIDMSLHHLLQDQINYLQAHGFMVDGISSSGPYVTKLEAAGIKHTSIEIAREIAPFKDLISLFRLYRLFRKGGYTIVHTHNPKPGLIGQLAAKLAGVPIIVNTVHGLYFHENTPSAQKRLFVFLEWLAARCSDLILSQNREDIETILKLKIAEPDKIKFLGNGIDISQFDGRLFSAENRLQTRARLGIAPSAPVIGFVGRLAAKRKGFLDFLEAGQRLAERLPDVRFLIVGAPDPGKADAVSPEIAADYGLTDHCIFLGHRPNHELPELYSLMNVLVLPSLFEGVPRAVMEASAMSVPAVVTDVKGNREAVAHDENGLLVPLGDVDALTESIFKILTDEGLANRLGRQGRQRAETLFDELLVFERVKEFYRGLLQTQHTVT